MTNVVDNINLERLTLAAALASLAALAAKAASFLAAAAAARVIGRGCPAFAAAYIVRVC